MDFKAKLLAEMAKKRKAVSSLEVKDGNAKFVRGADLETRRNQEYEAKQEELAKKKKLAQPDLNEGWENELQTAMKVIGKEMDKAVVEGTADSATRHDIALPKGYEEDNWKSIEHMSTLLGVGE
ncbi:hypothetical protein CAEBREN_28308 [Caenorhabditis brenneri]|uniref:Uncharacterized protein n=1 Tax=Caenorhabditis brenneri TaxID=135651 RepID=G0PBZ4_CAEBE|nr:hypothetical protein CAEBREN_28308 [Caenorhabditis brenneri]